MAKIDPKDFRVASGHKVNLQNWATNVDPVYKHKLDYQESLADHVARLSQQQQLLYASNRHAVLMIFQAMDAAGKDGAIKHVMSGINPQGCQVFSFKHPSATELQHDFLWRTTRDLPERGRIGIFNRSYYEEVLIARVHPEILQNEGLPAAQSPNGISGSSGLLRSPIWKSIFSATGHAFSSSSFIFRKKNSAGGFLSALTNLRRTGNSVSQTSRNGNSGKNTWKHTENASARQAPPKTPGTSFPPMTRGTLGLSSPRSSSTRSRA